jgi:hypothetical protein
MNSIPFCVLKHVIGTPRHLLFNDGFSWVDVIPDHTFFVNDVVLENDNWCLNTVARLANVDLQLLPPSRFINAIRSCSFTGDVPWQKVMPIREHHAFVSGIIDRSNVSIGSPSLGYFETVWRAGNAVIASLQPVHVDRSKWQTLISLNRGNVPAIRSFEPNDEGVANRIVYNRFATLTGRLTVQSGCPQILTLNREFRNLMVSRYGSEGSIVAIDFASLEARVLLYEHGGSCDEHDLYGSIAREMGCDRNAVKGAVISELYGSSRQALSDALGMSGKELTAFVKRIKLQFRTSELLERIKASFIANGYLTNRYGRRVVIDDPLDNVLVNYYAQSTGVDVTMLGFNQIIGLLPNRAHPVFLLHDAMIVDVHNDDLEAVMAIDHVRVRGYIQRFYMKSTIIA